MYHRLSDSYLKYRVNIKGFTRLISYSLNKNNQQKQSKGCHDHIGKCSGCTLEQTRQSYRGTKQTHCLPHLLPFPIFHLSWFTHLPSYVSALEQAECDYRSPLPMAEIAFLICSLTKALSNIVQNHLKMSLVCAWVFHCCGNTLAKKSGQPWVAMDWFIFFSDKGILLLGVPLLRFPVSFCTEAW